ncbi:MAG: PIN domain-containing protein, partial [Candidatus Woesearchaeota archaeon]|nr:PIN domain-containing protein [Candidatus Woesearchaeota archaeon]
IGVVPTPSGVGLSYFLLTLCTEPLVTYSPKLLKDHLAPFFMKYLIDTCTWRDFYEDRVGIGGKYLGKYAAKFFEKILKEESIILFSEVLIRELKKDFDKERIHDMLHLLVVTGKLQRIEITEEEFTEAAALSRERNLPKIDCLCAVQARNHKACMISEDKHFAKLKDITVTKKPSDFIS